MKKRRLFGVAILSFFLLGACYVNKSIPGTKTVNTTSEIERLRNVSGMPSYVQGTVVKQFSSYDRTGMNNDGFSGQYSYIRKEADGSLVIFEEKGSGVIERIWTPTPTDDTLDFYFDGNTRPSFSIKFRDLFNGKVYPFVKPAVGEMMVGGFYSYIPIPYKNGCKIVFRGDKILFHQLQFRTYDQNYTVETFDPVFDEKEKAALSSLVNLWSKENPTVADIYNSSTKQLQKKSVLNPGETLVLAELNSGGRILGIEIDPADAFEGMDKQVDLRITWDDETNPAVYAPVADYFGYAFGELSMKSLLIGHHGNKLYHYFPMPFDKNAKLELIYRKKTNLQKPIDIKAIVYYNNDKRNRDAEGKFYSYWKREQPALGKPYVFVEGNGKGHYVGTILHSQATTATHFTEFFEGDDSTVIDGVNSIHGTGSEDYFNGGWYAQPNGWTEKKGTNLHGCLDYSLPFGRTGGYRFYISDKLPFNQSIYHSMEHGPDHNNRAVDYISVAMYYSDKPIAQAQSIRNELTTVLIPDTLTFYARLMDHLSYTGSVGMKDGSAEFNGGDNAILNINVKELPSGRYDLIFHAITEDPSAIQVSVLGNGTGDPNWSRLEGKKGWVWQDIKMGEITISDPNKPLQVAFKPGAKRRFVFDMVLLSRK